MQVMFTRWCLDPKGRTQITVNPERVDRLEHYGHAFVAASGEDFPAATMIFMKGRQTYTYIVQGDVKQVQFFLNEEITSGWPRSQYRYRILNND